MRQEYLDTYYNPDWVYHNIKNYFKIDEFFRRYVINKTIAKYGKVRGEEKLWGQLDFRLLSNLLYIRISLNKRIFANDADNPKLDERGFRDNLCDYVKSAFSKYQLLLSGHVTGKAIDFTVEGMTAEEVRNWIEQQGERMPYKCRLEWKMNGKYITWVHMDVIYEESNPYIYKFNI